MTTNKTDPGKCIHCSQVVFNARDHKCDKTICKHPQDRRINLVDNLDECGLCGIERSEEQWKWTDTGKCSNCESPRSCELPHTCNEKTCKHPKELRNTSG